MKLTFAIAPIISLMIVLPSYSQIVVETVTADEAVNFLVGTGVEYSNPMFTGDPLQLGYLSGGNGTFFPIESGVILSSDDANAIEPGYIFQGMTATVSGYPDLLDVANSVPPLIGQSFTVSSINDIAVLEFDFVPTGDLLSFTYSFGSDEYLTFVNTQYNDAFAFFVAGPGITGPYSAPAGFPDGSINIAVLPGTDPAIPITISSVQPNLNGEYYIDNPFPNIDILTNGFTVELTATINVVCGETYHIRLAIGDGADTALESIVVLTEGSFDASTLVAINPEIDPIGGVADGVMLEGCSSGAVLITPPCIFNEQTVPLVFGGDAIIDDDYSIGGVTEITLTPGEDILLDVDVLEDGLTEGAETLTITFNYLDFEGNPQTATMEVQIIDLVALQIESISNIPLCGDLVVTPTLIGGYPEFLYLWSDQSSNSSLAITELGDYTVTVTDHCGQIDSEEFSVVPPSGVQLQMEDDAFTCLDGDVDVTVEVVVGAPNYTFIWTGSSSSSATATFEADDAGMQYVTVTDNCDQTAVDSVLIVIPTQLVGAEDLTLCVNVGTGQLASGGSSPYTYIIDEDDEDAFESDDEYVFIPLEAGVYEIDVVDACGQQATIPVIVEACDTKIPNVFTPDGDGKNDSFEIFGIDNFPKSELKIFNRWGGLVYESNSYSNGWSGSDSVEGVYFYTLKRSDGKTFEGHVQLLRD